MTNNNENLKVFHDGIEWWVAESADELFKMVEEHTGLEVGDDFESDSFEILHEDSLLRIFDDEGGTQEKTIGEWIKINGRGFLCSTEY